MNIEDRYSIIDTKYKREIVLLKGSGCYWSKCTFCDYHTDRGSAAESNILNEKVLKNVTGIYNRLEVVNSGSFQELNSVTRDLIKQICIEKRIKELTFESHYKYKDSINSIKEDYKKLGISVFVKTGVETFNDEIRNSFNKDMPKNISITELKKYFDDICLLHGVTSQTNEMIENDIQIGLINFRRICINIFNNNTTNIKRDDLLIKEFMDKTYNKYIGYDNIDILINNTDFGVGD